ncbi:MAG: tetratricopeptide repeat protein, partial [Acidobacteriota bacterium]|nr:tetratricopeptide repeat protein [Acidobacteriota bacterium]
EGEDFAAAVPFLDEAIAVYERDHPEKIKNLADARSIRGGVLVRLERFAEAEPILIEAYEMLEKTESVNRTGRALGRIVELYDAWGKPEEAARWREKQTGS